MNPALIYLLKTAISLTLFYGFYWLFLRKETFFRFNRYYFLGSIVSSFILPLINIRSIFEKDVVPLKTVTESYTAFQNTVINPVTTAPVTTASSTQISVTDILIAVYIAGVIFLLLRMITQAFILAYRIRTSKIISRDNVKIVVNAKVKSPFSFYSYIFINPEQLHEDNIGEVILHEKEHIDQKHGIDLLLTELLTALHWPNPFAWLIKRSLIETHEYLADSAVLKHGVPVEEYQRALISFMLGAGNAALITPFNFSLNKKRLIMMKKIKSPSIRKWRGILLIPLLIILITAFSEQKKPEDITLGKMAPKTSLTDSSRIFSGNGPGMIILDGKEITRAEMDKIPPSEIAKVEVLKGESAKKYGEKGKQGVIIISSKQIGDKNRITGTVFDDETGKPMQGVSVIVYGTTTGAVSGPDGKYDLSIPEKEAKISFSFVGYSPVVTNLKSGSNSNIRMKKSITVINFNNLPKPPKPAPPEIKIDKTKPVFFVVEAMPEFPGGINALKDYINSNTRNPSKAKKKNITGTVHVNFTVDTDGKVTDVYIDKKNSIDPILDKEAVKVVSNMPKWKPAEQRGKKVPVQMSVPVDFKL